MKFKHLLLAALLLYVANSFAQPNHPKNLPSWQPDTAFIHLTNGTVYGFYHYIYNEHAQRTEEHYYVSEEGKWVERIRRFYTYDSDGNLLNDLQQALEEGQWKNKFQNSYAYNAKRQKTFELYQIWDDTLGRWFDQHRFHYSYTAKGELDTFSREDNDSDYLAHIFYRYDNHGNRILEQWQLWDTAWTDIFRATSIYNNNDQLVDYLEENWNHTHGGPPKLEWEPWLHYAYTYDSLGNNTELQTWIWLCVEEEWINEKHFYYTYDTLKRIESKLFMAWSRSKHEWVKKEYSTYEYDGNNNLVQSVTQTPYNNEWINHQTCTYIYDEADNMVSKTEAFWNTTDQCWDNSIWYTWDYDPAGNLLENTYYTWDAQKKNWMGVYRSLNHFNGQGNGDTCRYEMYDSRKGWYPFETNLYVTYNQTDTLGGFHTSKVSLHYRLYPDTTGIREASAPELRCYPNPTQANINVSTPKGEVILRYQIWDASGRLLSEQQPHQTEVVISLKDWPEGCYYLRCQTAKGMRTQMIIKQ